MRPGLVHATAVALGGRAVLLTGPSGSGKSDLALRLIDRGWVLVGDDYVDVFKEGGALHVRARPTIAGRIEVRGVGIVDTPTLDRAPVALVADLVSESQRMPDETPPLRSVRVVSLAPFEASAPIKLELALTRFGLAVEAPSR